MNKKLAIATFTGALLLTACGGETVYVMVDPTTPETTVKSTTTTVGTSAPRPSASTIPSSSMYDPESYDTAIWRDANEFWWSFTTEELLNMGLTICQEFDRGQSLDQVTQALVQILIVNDLTQYSNDVATMMGASLIYLCPEHSWWLDTI